jgi:hypothetical protein
MVFNVEEQNRPWAGVGCPVPFSGGLNPHLPHNTQLKQRGNSSALLQTQPGLKLTAEAQGNGRPKKSYSLVTIKAMFSLAARFREDREDVDDVSDKV